MENNKKMTTELQLAIAKKTIESLKQERDSLKSQLKGKTTLLEKAQKDVISLRNQLTEIAMNNAAKSPKQICYSDVVTACDCSGLCKEKC